MNKFLSLMLLCIVFAKNTTAQTIDKKEIVKNTIVNDTIESTYPDGLKGLKKFLERNINSGVVYDNNGPQGIYRVLIKFVIDTSGTVTDVFAETKLGYGVEDEALRVIKKLGKWLPASIKGKKVKSIKRQPITFMADDGDVSFDCKSGQYSFFANKANELLVSVNKVKDENLKVTISNGIIIKLGDGRYQIKVNDAKRVLVEVYITKTNKFIGSGFFDVFKN